MWMGSLLGGPGLHAVPPRYRAGPIQCPVVQSEALPFQSDSQEKREELKGICWGMLTLEGHLQMGLTLHITSLDVIKSSGAGPRDYLACH